MKLFSLLTLLIISFSAYSSNKDIALRRSNGLLRFIAEQEGLRDRALSGIIQIRCSRYLPYSEAEACEDAVKKMIALLDYDVVFSDKATNGQWSPSSFVFIAFKQKLLSLLSETKTKTYLYELNQQLYKFLTEEKENLNVWELTKTHFKTDYSTAMAIATLFQDTSSMKLHLAYLDQMKPNGSKVYEDNKELLSRVIDTINLVLDSSEENYRKLFYPEEIQKDLNRNIYHFYVPLFLTKALVKDGVKREAAYASTLMLTLTYEFITTAGSYRYILSDPDSIQSKYTLHDIFGGYCGSKIGLNGLNFNRSFTDISETFQRSTIDGVELLLKK